MTRFDHLRPVLTIIDRNKGLLLLPKIQQYMIKCNIGSLNFSEGVITVADQCDSATFGSDSRVGSVGQNVLWSFVVVLTIKD